MLQNCHFAAPRIPGTPPGKCSSVHQLLRQARKKNQLQLSKMTPMKGKRPPKQGDQGPWPPAPG